MNPIKIILASSSKYRAQLLEKLHIPFDKKSPNIDETPYPDETPEALCRRLSQQKAMVIGEEHPDTFIIGSDQVGHCGAHILGKTPNAQEAFKQLKIISGQELLFYTGLCLYHKNRDINLLTVVTTKVKVKTLTDDWITRYIELDQPFDCAGTLQVEGIGITLLESVETTDPNATIGLPLIKLSDFFENCGISLLKLANQNTSRG